MNYFNELDIILAGKKKESASIMDIYNAYKHGDEEFAINLMINRFFSTSSKIYDSESEENLKEFCKNFMIFIDKNYSDLNELFNLKSSKNNLRSSDFITEKGYGIDLIVKSHFFEKRQIFHFNVDSSLTQYSNAFMHNDRFQTTKITDIDDANKIDNLLPLAKETIYKIVDFSSDNESNSLIFSESKYNLEIHSSIKKDKNLIGYLKLLDRFYHDALEGNSLLIKSHMRINYDSIAKYLKTKIHKEGRSDIIIEILRTGVYNPAKLIYVCIFIDAATNKMDVSFNSKTVNKYACREASYDEAVIKTKEFFEMMKR